MDTTRRIFLAAAGAGMLAAGARGRAVGANDRVNVGIIGIGGRGARLQKLIQQRIDAKGDAEIVAVCDVYQKRLNEAARAAAGAKTYAYHEEMLEKGGLDAVFIATPDHWHAPITLIALKKGLDVYCEKPMTHTVEEAGKVAHAAAASDRILQVGVQSVSWAKWHKAKEAVDAGMLGQIVSCHGTYSRNDPSGDWNWKIDEDAGPAAKGDARVEWKQWLGPAPKRPFDADRFFRFRKYWDYSGGIATDLHYHTVAPFHLCVKNEHPTRVAGMGGLWTYHDGREVPDTFLDVADYPSKFQILVQSSQNNAYGPQAMIRGREATMLLGDDWEGREFSYIRIVPERPFAAAFRKKYGSAELRIEGAGNEGDQKHVDNFFESVRSRRQPNCNADLASKVMTHIGLAVRSYREGKVFYFDSNKEKVTTSAPA
jgi:predicted dehydrogenase